MSTTLTFNTHSLTLRQPLIIKISLQEILRSQTFKIAAELLTLISLFTAAFVWSLALPTI